MGKPYSLDLRKRVVAAIEGGMSRNQAAKQFGVAISTAIGWMQRVDETGSVAPGQMGGHKPKAISGEHAAWLSQRIRAGDFTLRGLVAELAGRGLKVDYRSVWEFVHAEKLSFKKKAWWLANATVPTWRGGAHSGQSIKTASNLSGWSSSTRPGPGPIWLHCGDGRRAVTG
jgi:transposase